MLRGWCDGLRSAWSIEFLRDGGFGAEAVALFGPLEAEGHAVGVEEKAFVTGFLGEKAVFGEVAVGGVADDREVAFLALDPQLVAASGVGEEGKEGEHGLAGDDALLNHVAVGGVAFYCGGGAQAALLVADLQLVAPLLVAPPWHAEDEGGVFFFHLAVGKAFADEIGERGV